MPIFKTKTIWTHLQQFISQAMFLTKNLRCIWGTPSYEAVGCEKPDEAHETSLKAKCLSFACLFSCQQFGYIRIYPEKNEFNLYDLYIKSRRYTFHSLLRPICIFRLLPTLSSDPEVPPTRKLASRIRRGVGPEEPKLLGASGAVMAPRGCTSIFGTKIPL